MDIRNFITCNDNKAYLILSYLRYKDCIKRHLSIDGNFNEAWENEAKSRPVWKRRIKRAVNATECRLERETAHRSHHRVQGASRH